MKWLVAPATLVALGLNLPAVLLLVGIGAVALLRGLDGPSVAYALVFLLAGIWVTC